MDRRSWPNSALFLETPLRWRRFHKREQDVSKRNGAQEMAAGSETAEDSCPSWTYCSFYSSCQNDEVSFDRRRMNGSESVREGDVETVEGFGQCPYCNREVLEEQESSVVTIFGLSWHKSCFRCDRCSRQLQALGGFICLLNSPICIECYLSVNSKEEQKKPQSQTNEASQHTSELSAPDATYGTALTGTLPTDMLSILYLNESNSEIFFMDTFVTFEQPDTSEDAFRRNSTPLLMYTQLQNSPDYGFESFSRVFTSDSDDNASGDGRRSQTENGTTNTFCSCVAACDLSIRDSPTSDEDQLACRTGQDNGAENLSESLPPNGSSYAPETCSYSNDTTSCLSLGEMTLVRRRDTPFPFQSVLSDWQNTRTLTGNFTFLLSPANTILLMVSLNSLHASRCLNATRVIQTCVTPKRPLPEACLISNQGGKSPHPTPTGRLFCKVSTVLRALIMVSILLMATIFCTR